MQPIQTTTNRAVERAQIVSQGHRGALAGEIAATCGVDPETVRRWVKRFNAHGLALPFAAWTLDGLVAYPSEAKGITMKRTRLDEVLRAEGLRWRKQET